MHTLIYKYFPRFTTGIFLITLSHDGDVLTYRLLTGQVQYPTKPNHYIAEVRYFNLFGLILMPKIIATYRKK